MVNKYAHHLENQDINPKTDAIWTIQDVPKSWRNPTEAKVIQDGYYFDEDGVAQKIPENNAEDE